MSRYESNIIIIGSIIIILTMPANVVDIATSVTIVGGASICIGLKMEVEE